MSLALLLLAPFAVAHTGLRATVPADGETVAVAPATISLQFHGDVRLIRLAPSQGGTAAKISFSPAAAARADYSVPVEGLGAGDVNVNWAAIGADGHTVTGSYSFVIAPAAPEVASP